MSTRSVLRALPAGNGITAPELDSADRLVQSLRESGLDGAVPKIARRLKVSQSAIYKQIDGENRSALEALCDWLDGAVEAKPTARRAALAPLYYLIDRYLTAADLGAESEAQRCMALSCSEAIREVAEVVQVALRSPDCPEGAEFEREWSEAITALHLLRRTYEVRRGGQT